MEHSHPRSQETRAPVQGGRGRPSARPSTAGGHAAIAFLQRTAGNRAVASLLASAPTTAQRLSGIAGASLSRGDNERDQIGGVTVSRDLAVQPPHPDAVAPELTEAQLKAAVSYNAFRFKDPYSLANVRDLVGAPRFPAVSDEDLARAVSAYQAQFGLPPDGKAGPETTARLATELTAEGSGRDATLLLEDNYITWSDAVAAAWNQPGAPGDANGFATFFQWDVNFATSLRNGWLIQEIANTWVATDAAGTAIAGGAPTPHYWEAWWVDGTGHISIATAISADRKRATSTGEAAGAHDMWRRNAPANSRGNWRMAARLFTTKTLPAGFAIHAVPDAVDLPSTAAAPNSDQLGQAEASRSVGGRWDGIVAPPTHVRA